jgi:hypothetical protein
MYPERYPSLVMNIPTTRLSFLQSLRGVLPVVATSLLVTLAFADTKPVEISFARTANIYATLFLQQEDTSETALAAFFSEQGITDEAIQNAIRRSANVGEKITTRFPSAQPGSELFRLLLDENRLGVSAELTRPMVSSSSRGETSDASSKEPKDPPAETATDGVIRYFNVGVRKLSPYKLTEIESEQEGAPVRKRLDRGDNSTTAFIEFVYANRWAWNTERIGESWKFKYPKGGAKRISAYDDGRRNIPWTLGKNAEFFDGRYWDVDFRLSYNFDGDDTTAAAIVGTSDIGLEVGIGRHIARDVFETGGAYSLNMDLNYSLSTDRSAFDAHHRVFAGPSYTASFRVPGGEKRLGLFYSRLGWASVDSLVFVSKDSREVKLEHGDLPLYRQRDALAFEAELVYPVGKDAAFTFGGRIYGIGDPNTWTVQIGYTKPLSDLAKALFPNASPEEKQPSSGAPAKTKADERSAPTPPATRPTTRL